MGIRGGRDDLGAGLGGGDDEDVLDVPKDRVVEEGEERHGPRAAGGGLRS